MAKDKTKETAGAENDANVGTAEAQPPAAETLVPTVTVQVLHPIVFENVEYGRGLHELAPDVAKFFLELRVPNRVKGPQPVAQIPAPAEEPKKGETKALPVDKPKTADGK